MLKVFLFLGLLTKLLGEKTFYLQYKECWTIGYIDHIKAYTEKKYCDVVRKTSKVTREKCLGILPK